MELTWISVADTAIKIGLGSVITAISGYLVLGMTQKNENLKEQKNRFYKFQEDRKTKYVEFLSQSHNLVQAHLYTSCSCDTEDYKNYLKIFSEVQIISCDEIRIVASNLLASVNGFISINKNTPELKLSENMRKSVNDNSGIFQKMAQEDISKVFSET